MKTSRIVEREIIREIRLKLRLYFPELQSFIDKKIITKNDWIFFGMIQLNLVKCFTITPEDAIRKSKAQINQITKFYELETRVRKTALSSNSFLKENDFIMTHDYAPDREYHSIFMRSQIWEWCENVAADLEAFENDIVPASYWSQQFLNVAWSCWEKV